MVSAALVSTLVGLAASNLGILPHDAPAYSIVLEFLLPLTIPLLLFGANLQQVVRSTGMLLVAFLLGSGDSIYLNKNGRITIQSVSGYEPRIRPRIPDTT